ncbi:hypothetical protein T11_12458 [Trichinella zimbabwensis]|uniref:Uncharacterized protein n=1 Tax=Trichinella zimbabwensis TaxID=268475 RepID=A0A0V1H643_9BILA|nr:hypothetical protein T11_12458 [Trichinella zimbabwensis]
MATNSSTSNIFAWYTTPNDPLPINFVSVPIARRGGDSVYAAFGCRWGQHCTATWSKTVVQSCYRSRQHRVTVRPQRVKRGSVSGTLCGANSCRRKLRRRSACGRLQFYAYDKFCKIIKISHAPLGKLMQNFQKCTKQRCLTFLSVKFCQMKCTKCYWNCHKI